MSQAQPYPHRRGPRQRRAADRLKEEAANRAAEQAELYKAKAEKWELRFGLFCLYIFLPLLVYAFLKS